MSHNVSSNILSYKIKVIAGQCLLTNFQSVRKALAVLLKILFGIDSCSFVLQQIKN